MKPIIFNTIPFESENGLSTQLPNHRLPSYLERGTTPQTPSYSVKRNPVFISHATALSNQDMVYNSYDDNELTEWRNDGRIKTGKITYTLTKSSLVNECVVKFSGWRRKSYPIRILADNQLVYEGETERSLGYITIPLKPVLSNEITIELIGINTDSDAFNQIVEVDPNKELDMFKETDTENKKGQLRIVEIEFYEKL